MLCEQILAACTDPLEATYVIKIIAGELRIGLREGLIADAVAEAFGIPAAGVRRAASYAGDIGAVALAAKHDTLDEIAIAYHAPIAFMLATPIAYGSDYKDLAAGTWLVEDKYDGIRIQAHVTPERVSLFSRTLNDVAASYPEIVAALRALPGSFALDGEIVAERDGRVLPFRYLQARLQRKDVSAELMAEVPVRYVAFDALARDDRFLARRTARDAPRRTQRTARRFERAHRDRAVEHARNGRAYPKRCTRSSPQRANAATKASSSSAAMRRTRRANAASGGSNSSANSRRSIASSSASSGATAAARRCSPTTRSRCAGRPVSCRSARRSAA